MQATKIWRIAAKLIFLVGFNAIFFILAGFDNPTSVWIAYAMIHVAYLLLVFMPKIAGGGKRALEKSAPLQMFALINFGVHFIVGLLFIFIAPDGCKFEIILYIILWAIYLAVFFSTMNFNAHTEATGARQDREVFFIKNQASKIKSLINKTADAELSRMLETVSDNMHASPSRSHNSVATIEASITMKVCEIEMAIRENRTEDSKKACRELEYFIEERNRVLNIIN